MLRHPCAQVGEDGQRRAFGCHPQHKVKGLLWRGFGGKCLFHRGGIGQMNDLRRRACCLEIVDFALNALPHNQHALRTLMIGDAKEQSCIFHRKHALPSLMLLSKGSIGIVLRLLKIHHIGDPLKGKGRMHTVAAALTKTTKPPQDARKKTIGGQHHGMNSE